MRILIVDDAEALRVALAHVVTSLGHEVVGRASDGPTALALAAASDPDAIAIDGRLTEPDAVALIGSLRSAVPRARLYVVASLGETALLRAARQAGAHGALARPFVRSQVDAALQASEREPPPEE